MRALLQSLTCAILAIPLATASGTLDAGAAAIMIENGHDGGCIEDATGLCIASVSGDTPGGTEVDARQNFRYLGVAANRSFVRSWTGFALLPDHAIYVDSSDLTIHHPVFRILVENIGTIRGPGPLHDHALLLTEDNFSVELYGPSAREMDPEFKPGRRAEVIAFYDKGIGYESFEPAGEFQPQSTDWRVGDTTTGACGSIEDDDCQANQRALTRALAQSTPNLIAGVGFYDLGVATDPAALGSNDAPAGAPPPPSLRGARSPTAMPVGDEDRGDPREDDPPSTPSPGSAPADTRPQSGPPPRQPPVGQAPVRLASETPVRTPAPAAVAIAAGIAVAGLLAALYHRITSREAALRCARREQLMQALQERGPLTLAELARTLRMDRTTILYHARTLARLGHVVLLRQGRNKFVALPGQTVPKGAAARANPVTDAVMTLLRQNGGKLRRDELEAQLAQFPAARRRSALRRLVSMGIIERRRPVEILALTSGGDPLA